MNLSKVLLIYCTLYPGKTSNGTAWGQARVKSWLNWSDERKKWDRERERERLRECEYVSEGLCMCEHVCVCLRMSAQDCVRGPLVCVREGRCISMEECAWMCVCPCKCLLLSVLHRPLCFCLHKVCQSDRAASSPCNDLCLSSAPMLSQIQATCYRGENNLSCLNL